MRYSCKTNVLKTQVIRPQAQKNISGTVHSNADVESVKGITEMKKFTLCVLFLLALASRAFSAPSEIDTLRNSMRSNVDEVEGIKWINDKATPQKLDAHMFYVYLGQRGGHTWARLYAGFVKEDWVFFNRLVINSDGAKYTIDFNSFKDKDSDVIYGGTIYEKIDIKAEPYMPLLKTISKSKKTIVRFSGKNDVYDIVLTKKQKDALKRVIRYYELVK